jgi:hypothetical protein
LVCARGLGNHAGSDAPYRRGDHGRAANAISDGSLFLTLPARADRPAGHILEGRGCTWKRNREFADSPLEESGFELMVPPRTERKWEGAGTHQHHLGRAFPWDAAILRCNDRKSLAARASQLSLVDECLGWVERALAALDMAPGFRVTISLLFAVMCSHLCQPRSPSLAIC